MSDLREKVYNLLNPNDRRNRQSSAVNITIITLILVNVIVASLETVEPLHAAHEKIFFLIEIFSVVFFTMEYALRLWSIPENSKYRSRRHFLPSFDSIIDLLAIAPFYLGYIFSIDLRALIALRLLRLLKLVRYFEPLAILGTVMKAEFRAFMAAMFLLMILVFVASTGIYIFERQAQPDVFGSIPLSMWWAIVTLTTLGYGDVVPVTLAGRVFAAAITILSIGTVALPAGMLASRFSEEFRKRKDSMEDHILALIADGTLSIGDRIALEEYRKKFCLSVDDMQKLLDKCETNSKICPTCRRERDHGG